MSRKSYWEDDVEITTLSWRSFILSQSSVNSRIRRCIRANLFVKCLPLSSQHRHARDWVIDDSHRHSGRDNLGQVKTCLSYIIMAMACLTRNPTQTPPPLDQDWGTKDIHLIKYELRVFLPQLETQRDALVITHTLQSPTRQYQKPFTILAGTMGRGKWFRNIIIIKRRSISWDSIWNTVLKLGLKARPSIIYSPAVHVSPTFVLRLQGSAVCSDPILPLFLTPPIYSEYLAGHKSFRNK